MAISDAFRTLGQGISDIGETRRENQRRQQDLDRREKERKEAEYQREEDQLNRELEREQDRAFSAKEAEKSRQFKSATDVQYQVFSAQKKAADEPTPENMKKANTLMDAWEKMHAAKKATASQMKSVGWTPKAPKKVPLTVSDWTKGLEKGKDSKWFWIDDDAKTAENLKQIKKNLLNSPEYSNVHESQLDILASAINNGLEKGEENVSPYVAWGRMPGAKTDSILLSDYESQKQASQDLNKGKEKPPKEPPKNGKKYTMKQLKDSNPGKSDAQILKLAKEMGITVVKGPQIVASE